MKRRLFVEEFLYNLFLSLCRFQTFYIVLLLRYPIFHAVSNTTNRSSFISLDTIRCTIQHFNIQRPIKSLVIQI